MKTFDAGVVGLNTMGIFVCREFARRRLRVIGFDQFDPPHGRGSNTGDTRVFRIAYAEHPDYVPLAHRAGVLGDQLGAEEGATLLQRTGMLSIGEPDSGLITGTRSQCGGTRSDARLSVAGRGTHELCDLQAARGVECAVRASGRLDRCGPSLRAGLRQAVHSGAELYTNSRLEDWQWKGSAFELTTSDGASSAGTL